MLCVQLALLLAGSTACFAVAAQDDVPAGARVKTTEVVRVDTAPVLDGQLDDSVWSQAFVIDDLHQVNPTEYAEPSVATRIYLVYTEDAFYIGAELLDDNAADITARVLRQGESIFADDVFGVILDPFNDRRSGFRFSINPNGVRQELLYQNTSQQNDDWQGIWHAAASQNEDGWIAEIEIPFKTLSFDPANDSWGINFMRWLPRQNEWIGWVSRNNTLNPGIAGLATGFENMEQGLGLDIVPSLSLSKTKAYAPSMSDSDNKPSLDVFYKLTPSLNAALTINTDFSATEVDDRQVDLSRFSLFFPEKRDFFLTDADIFEFGRLGSISNFGSGPIFSRPSLENGRPFFSRRIGLSATGEPVDVEYGGKLSGRVGRWNLGALAIRQDEFGEVDATDIFVGRVAANVLEESSVGVMLTDGDPRSNLGNSLVGIDFRYLNTRLANGLTLRGDAWYQQTETDGLEGDDSAYGFRLQMPTGVGFRGSFGIKELQENFNPALGFVNRRGIRDHTLELGYSQRRTGGVLQTLYGGVDLQRINRIDGGLQTEVAAFRLLELQTRTRDNFDIRYTANKEVVLSPFEISEGIFIAAGEYSFDESGFDITTGGHRALSGSLNYRTGDFYNGERLMLNGSLIWSPSRNFRARIGYEFNDVELPEGDFVVRLLTLQADIVFSSTLSWVNLIQYDNVSETAGINSRLHWIPEAGREAFIVLNHTLQDLDRDNTFKSSQADLTLKFSYTFRY